MKTAAPVAGVVLAILGSWLSPDCRAQLATNQETATIAQAIAGMAADSRDAAERDEFASQLPKLVANRRAELNRASSEAWQAIRTLEDWRRMRDAKIAALRSSLGEFPEPPRQQRILVTSRIDRQEIGVVIENLVFESRPQVWVSANLYRPRQLPARLPGILISHAHHTPKEHGELQDMGMTWARAGCYVLVPDHVGHGERRQHPFVDEKSHSSSFRVGRQDYYFRYDLGIKLHLLGDSLMGWMAWDLSRGVDCLLAQPNIDREKIALLGAVAGGGDPCAVTAALDDRIAAAVPFNFGGPQPETRFPLPEDAESSFNYAGGGSWESTRNLASSASGGFLPWVIVGATAPRRLVYGHEFSWDKQHDPVWRRLETIFRLHGHENNLASTHGFGVLSGQPPNASHCTHIGAVHRQQIHAAFKQWFGIELHGGEEFSGRLAADQLRCFRNLPANLPVSADVGPAMAEIRDSRLAHVRSHLSAQPTIEARRRELRAAWKRVLGDVSAPSYQVSSRAPVEAGKTQFFSAERIVVDTEFPVRVSMLILSPSSRGVNRKLPAVLIVSHAGQQALLREHAMEYARLLEAGYMVCLFDPRGTGMSRVGSNRGRSSSATSNSSSLLMLGDPLVAGQLRDLRAALAIVRASESIDTARIAVWGDARSPTALPSQPKVLPRDDDSLLPPNAEPCGVLLAALVALFEDGIQRVCLTGGMAGFGEVVAASQVRIPHDVVVPGLLKASDLPDLFANLAGQSPVRIESPVDAWNVPMDVARLEEYQKQLRDTLGGSTDSMIIDHKSSAVEWILSRSTP